jgi:hypothetical protein
MSHQRDRGHHHTSQTLCAIGDSALVRTDVKRARTRPAPIQLSSEQPHQRTRRPGAGTGRTDPNGTVGTCHRTGTDIEIQEKMSETSPSVSVRGAQEALAPMLLN